jgi:hypothetical protein
LKYVYICVCLCLSIYGPSACDFSLVTILTLVGRLYVRFIPYIMQYNIDQDDANSCVLCTLNYVANNYGDVDWSAPWLQYMILRF